MCYDEFRAEEQRSRVDLQDKLRSWMVKQAEKHNTFRLWLTFLLKGFPAYIGFRTAVRTGNLKLRMAAFCRLAPLFWIAGKDRYQSLAAHHLFDLAAMPDSDLDVLSEFFSVAIGDDPSVEPLGEDGDKKAFTISP